MSNPNKVKGTKWETAIVDYLTAMHSIRARRVAQTGRLDTGDIHGVPYCIIQAKDWKSWESAIREGLDGAQVQKVRAGEPFGVAFVKRARKPVGQGYAVTTIEDFANILQRLADAEARAKD